MTKERKLADPARQLQNNINENPRYLLQCSKTALSNTKMARKLAILPIGSSVPQPQPHTIILIESHGVSIQVDPHFPAGLPLAVQA